MDSFQRNGTTCRRIGHRVGGPEDGSFRQCTRCFDRLPEQEWTRAETPAQRDAVINALDEAWSHFPNLRLGQLIENAVGYHQGAKTFYIEDHDLIDALTELATRYSEIK